MIIINDINIFVTWLANCPYFIVFTGICSIVSIITLSKILAILKPTIKPDYPPNIGLEIVLRLIDQLKNTDISNLRIYCFIFSNDETFPQITSAKIDKLNSFQFFFSSSKIRYFLITYNRHLYLFASCCDFAVPVIKCIASDIKTKSLKSLFDILISQRPDTDNFIRSLLTDIK